MQAIAMSRRGASILDTMLKKPPTPAPADANDANGTAHGAASGAANGGVPANGVKRAEPAGGHVAPALPLAKRPSLQALPQTAPYVHRLTFDTPEEPVTAVKISHDGSKLAASSAKGVIRVYHLPTGALCAVLQGHTKGISTVAFSPICSDILASGSDDLTIRIWSLSQRKCIRVLKKHTYHITTLVFNSKGSILVSGAADETIIVWDLTSGRSLKTLAAHLDPVSSVCLTQDDTMIISASFDGLMRLFDTETGQCLKTLVYNSSSHGTATASTNDVVNSPVLHITVSPNSKYVLSTSLDGKIRLWDYMHNKVVKTFLGPDGAVNQKYCSGLCFVTRTPSPLVVSGLDCAGVLFWDLQMKSLVCRLLPSETILDVSISPDNSHLAVCSLLGSVHLYEWNAE